MQFCEENRQNKASAAMTGIEENIVNITMMAAKLQSEGKICLDSDAVGFMGLTQTIIQLAHQFEEENTGVDYNAEGSNRDYWMEIDAFAEKELLEHYGVEEPAKQGPLNIVVVVRDGAVETVRKDQDVPACVDIVDINDDFGVEGAEEVLADVLNSDKYLDCDFSVGHYCEE